MLASEVGASQPFVVVDRQTRRIVAGFASREEAEAFREGQIVTDARASRDLSIRAMLPDPREQKGRPDRPSTSGPRRGGRGRRRRPTRGGAT
jgi:hypothetical protein